MICFCIILGYLGFSSFGWADEPCKSSRDITVYCGFSGPEDLVHVPDSPYLIVSQYAAHGQSKPGNLVYFNMESEKIQPLFPSALSETAVTDVWGEKHCTVPPKFFSPHGIDLVRRLDGDLMLLAISHNGDYGDPNRPPDSVQFFKVIVESQGLSLMWRGCVFVQRGSSLNDLAALQDGGFIVPAVRFLGGKIEDSAPDDFKTEVLSWNKYTGMSTLLDLEGMAGIDASIVPDGSLLFLNEAVSGRVIKVSLPDANVISTTEVTKVPDNNSWGENGNLLVTSIILDSGNAPRLQLCNQQKKSHCAIPFEITSLDPVSMRTVTLFRHDGEEIFGAATVAVQVEDYLYLGVGFGDRIARIEFPQEKMIQDGELRQ